MPRSGPQSPGRCFHTLIRFTTDSLMPQRDFHVFWSWVTARVSMFFVIDFLLVYFFSSFFLFRRLGGIWESGIDRGPGLHFGRDQSRRHSLNHSFFFSFVHTIKHIHHLSSLPGRQVYGPSPYFLRAPARGMNISSTVFAIFHLDATRGSSYLPTQISRRHPL